MKNHRYTLFIAVGSGVAIMWLLVLLIIHILNGMQPTASSLLLWTQRQNLSALTADQRAHKLDALADQINELSFAERQKLNGQRGLQPIIKQMTEDERLALLDKTLPQGFSQIMDAINRMKPEDRRQMVERALDNMKKMDPQQMQDRPPEFNAAVQKVIQVGFSSYLQNASAQTKMDMAPLIEQIQVNMQTMGGKPQ